jgi:hypothetical protein
MIESVKLLTPRQKFAALDKHDWAELQCLHCCKVFSLEKHRVQRAVERGTGKYCSPTCARHARRTSQEARCANCETLFRKHMVELRRTGNHFCSSSCAAQYNNPNKNLGAGRRSGRAEDYVSGLIRRDFPSRKMVQKVKTMLDAYYASHIRPLLET